MTRLTRPPINLPAIPDRNALSDLKGKDVLVILYVGEEVGTVGIVSRVAEGMSAEGRAAVREVLEQIIADLREPGCTQ